MNHWARQYIGRPWAPDADGPDRFSCWGLVRHVFRTRHAIEFPHVAVAELDDKTLDNVAAIKQAARASGMRPLSQRQQLQPIDEDIILMRSLLKLHCGLVVAANGRIGVLHSAHAVGVAWEPWRDAVAGMSYELWRRA